MWRQSKPQMMIEPLESRRLLAAGLFADLSPAGLTPQNLTPLGSKLIFTASTPETGKELWISDGTDAGTKMIKEIRPGIEGSIVFSQLVRSGPYVYFVADDGGDNHGLWRTDGTRNGTIMLKQFVLEHNLSVAWLTDFNGVLMFSTQGILWKSDGTPAGTTIVKRVADENNSLGQPDVLVRAGKWVYFFLSSSDDKPLWRSDGTRKGTAPYFNLTRPSFPESVQAIGNDLYVFGGPFNAPSLSLWKTDAALGMINLGDFSDVHSFAEVNGSAWFTAEEEPYGPDSVWRVKGQTIQRLYTTNDDLTRLAVVGGQVLTTEIEFDSGTGSTSRLLALNSKNGNLTVVKDFSSATAGGVLSVGAGAIVQVGGPTRLELWTTDGTATGTARLSKVLLRPENLSYGYSGPQFAVVNGQVFFDGLDMFGDTELWKSDLTSAGTRMIKDVRGGPADSNVANLITAGNKLYFTTQHLGNVHIGRMPQLCFWQTDGVSPPRLLHMFEDDYHNSATLFTAGKTVLAAIENTNDPGLSELWRIDESGTLSKIKTGVEKVSVFFKSSTRTFFTTSNNFQSDGQLWVTDGTAKGTILLRDAPLAFSFTGARFSTPAWFEGKLYFVWKLPDNKGQQLWRTDGTAKGTSRVKDWFQNLNNRPTRFDNLCVYRERLYFSGYDETYKSRIWRSNGTAAGTTVVIDKSPVDMGVAGKTLYFSIFDEDAGAVALFRSDGTGRGTTHVKTFAENSRGTQSFRAGGDVLYFEVGLPAFGQWVFVDFVSDGTPDGTNQAIWPQFPNLSLFGDRAYLTNASGIFRGERGLSRQIATFPGYTPGAPVQLGDQLFIPVTDAAHGLELWSYRSDSAISGTVFLDDNADGQKQAAEPGLGGFRIFLDDDHDGTFDPGEWFTRSASNGQYVIDDLLPGTYDLLIESMEGRSPTIPYDTPLNLAAGAIASRNFGVK